MFGVQTFLENQLVKWVKNCIKKTKINTLVLGGGVFMNVKANQKIMTLNEVKKLFVFPSCGDESLSMGAAWLRYYQKRKTEFKPKFNNIYLGRDYNDYYISKTLSKSLKNKKKYYFKKINNIESKIASLLAQNKIVARFSSKS